MFRLATIIIMVLSLSGCALNETSTQGRDQNQCSHIERNLTVAWQDRSYWCVPNQ